MAYAPEVIEALATLRLFTGPAGAHVLPGQVVQAINVLDDAGVFAELDEQDTKHVHSGCGLDCDR